MASRSKKTTKGFVRPRKTRVQPEEENRESLWNFDDIHDAATVICEVIQEEIINNPSVDLRSYMQFTDTVTSDLNKSDVVLVISSAVCARLGMDDVKTKLLSESDVVTTMYDKLGLEDKAVLKMFCTMIGILCPEIIKSIEFAIFELMRNRSSRTTAGHTTSRIQASMRGAIESQTVMSHHAALAALNSNIAIDEDEMISGINNLLVNAPRAPTFIKEIEPSESVSRNVSPVPSATISGSRLSTQELMQLARYRTGFDEKAEELYVNAPASSRPATVKKAKGRQGVGFSDALKMIPVERAQQRNERIKSLVNEKTKGSLRQLSSGYQAAHVEEGPSDDDSGDLDSLI